MHKHLTATVRGRDYYAVSFHEERGRKWHLTSVFLSRKFYGHRSLVVFSPWGCKESDMIDATEHALEGSSVAAHKI